MFYTIQATYLWIDANPPFEPNGARFWSMPWKKPRPLMASSLEEAAETAVSFMQLELLQEQNKHILTGIGGLVVGVLKNKKNESETKLLLHGFGKPSFNSLMTGFMLELLFRNADEHELQRLVEEHEKCYVKAFSLPNADDVRLQYLEWREPNAVVSDDSETSEFNEED